MRRAMARPRTGSVAAAANSGAHGLGRAGEPASPPPPAKPRPEGSAPMRSICTDASYQGSTSRAQAAS